jgi:pimeloyl-ACP methyl ester carboxylesterase
MSAPDKQPLVMLNGYAAAAADWDPVFLGRLAESHELICPENRGVESIDSMAYDVIALLDERELGSVVVAGWSMGGFVAQAVATIAPERVEGLVLMATDGGGPRATTAAPAVWARLIDHSGTPRERATRFIGLLFAPELAKTIDEQFGDIVAASQAALPVETLDAQVAAMEAWHATSQPGGSTPVLIAHGNDDIVIPATNADKLAQKWPASRVERFKGAGHGFTAQAPKELADLICSFTRR